jgi:hypothetical protein
MRPCLEDFIDVMACEFRFDLRGGAQRDLEDSSRSTTPRTRAGGRDDDAVLPSP